MKNEEIKHFYPNEHTGYGERYIYSRVGENPNISRFRYVTKKSETQVQFKVRIIQIIIIS